MIHFSLMDDYDTDIDWDAQDEMDANEQRWQRGWRTELERRRIPLTIQHRIEHDYETMNPDLIAEMQEGENVIGGEAYEREHQLEWDRFGWDHQARPVTLAPSNVPRWERNQNRAPRPQRPYDIDDMLEWRRNNPRYHFVRDTQRNWVIPGGVFLRPNRPIPANMSPLEMPRGYFPQPAEYYGTPRHPAEGVPRL